MYIMKNLTFIFALLVSVCSAFSLDANTTILESYSPNYFIETLQAGTPVFLETTEKVHSERATIGQIVQFKVLTNVTVKGNILIQTGALAFGRIKSISPTTFNNPEEITIELTTVQALDGQMVALNGTPQTFKGQFTGESMTVYPGERFVATVMNNTEIRY